MQRCRRERPPVTGRRGVALLMALVALMLATSICISVTRTLLLHQQRVERRVWRHQADLLAVSAVGFARRHLAQHPDATAAEWNVTLPGRDPAEGRVTLTFAPGRHEGERLVTIVAAVPTDRVERTQSTLRTRVIMGGSLSNAFVKRR